MLDLRNPLYGVALGLGAHQQHVQSEAPGRYCHGGSDDGPIWNASDGRRRRSDHLLQRQWRFYVALMGMGWGSSLNWLGLWVFVGLEGFRKRGVCGEKVFVVGIVWDLVGIAGTGT